MDLQKAKKIVQKNFKDYGVKSDVLDEETLVTFLCVDLVREDMAAAETPPPRPASTRRNTPPRNNDNQVQINFEGEHHDG